MATSARSDHLENDGPGGRATARFAAFSLLMPVVLFGAAGRLDWRMGWLYVGFLLALTVGTRALLARIDPGLLTERASLSRAGTKPWDRVIVVFVALVGPLVTWLVAGLDHRFAWPPRVPPALQAGAAVAIVVGGLLTSWAMASNPFFSAVVRIQRDRGHRVVTGGPYRLVRHPGYAGALLVTLAAPLMLDALWSAIPAALVVAALVLRTALEDRALRAELAGYEEYARATPSRLLPGVW